MQEIPEPVICSWGDPLEWSVLDVLDALRSLDSAGDTYPGGNKTAESTDDSSDLKHLSPATIRTACRQGNQDRDSSREEEPRESQTVGGRVGLVADKVELLGRQFVYDEPRRLTSAYRYVRYGVYQGKLTVTGSSLG